MRFRAGGFVSAGSECAMRMSTARIELCERGETLRERLWAASILFAAGGVLAAAACILPAPTASTASLARQSASGNTGEQAPPDASEIPAPATTKQPRSSDQRRAAKLYMESSKLFLNRQFAEAMKGFEQAAQLDPANNNYRLAALVARSHQVTALIQEAAKDKLLGNEPAPRGALATALALDPTNFEATQHLDETADESVRTQPRALYGQASSAIAGDQTLLAAPAPQSFHLHTDQRQAIDQVFKAYGLKAMLDDSVRPNQVRLDLDNVKFEEAAYILGLATHTFYVPLDAHQALVADDSHEKREQLTPQELETVYLTGLSADEMTEVQTVAKNVFAIQQAQLSPSESSLTLRAPAA